MTTLTKDQMLQDIYERVQAMQSPLTEEEVRQIVRETVESMFGGDGNGDGQRKMVFGSGQADQRLLGSKFARWGLSLGDIEYLYDLQTALHRFNPGTYPGPSEELANAFDAISEAYYVPAEKVREMDQRALDGEFPRIPLRFFYGPDRDIMRRSQWNRRKGEWEDDRWRETEAYQRAMRAMDTAETGFGLQLVGVEYVGELWDATKFESRVFNLLPKFEMRAPTVYLPVAADIPEMLFVSESATSSASDYSTSKTGSNRVQVDAKKFVIHQMWSGEMEEDSIVPFIPFLREGALFSISHYSDSLVLNGDTTNAGNGNINLDDADPADTKHYLALDGIRHVGLVDNTNNQGNQAGPITWAALVDARGRMIDTTYFNDWGHPTRMEDLIQVSDPETADKVVQLSEVVNSNIERGRPLFNGEVAQILGNPFIASVAVSKTEADGKVSTTPGNNILGQVVTFNRRGFTVGWRRRVKTMIEQLPASDQVRIVYSLRLGMGRWSPTGAASGIEAADVIYNISL